MMKNVFAFGLIFFMFFSPSEMRGTFKDLLPEYPAVAATGNERDAALLKESAALYDSMRLQDYGLGEKAFQFAWIGYQTLLEQGKLQKQDLITICDFSQSSRNKRLYIISLDSMKVVQNTYVAHGRNSGTEFAQYFSNTPRSHKSSLGFYVTGKTYTGQHGLSLEINGVEKGINDRALARRIVIHGSDYVGEEFLEHNPFTGRSYGCPAVPRSEIDFIIQTIKEGSCLFIYHPSTLYLKQSKILNG